MEDRVEGDDDRNPSTVKVNDDPISIRPSNDPNTDTPPDERKLGEDGILRDDVGNKVSIEVGGRNTRMEENGGTDSGGSDEKSIEDARNRSTHDYNL